MKKPIIQIVINKLLTSNRTFFMYLFLFYQPHKIRLNNHYFLLRQKRDRSFHIDNLYNEKKLSGLFKDRTRHSVFRILTI